MSSAAIQQILTFAAVALSTAAATALITRRLLQERARAQLTHQRRSINAFSPCSRDPRDPSARTEYLSWDDYFMAVAFLSSQRSKDPNKQVGACIVGRDQIILGIGYNGFPRGCHDGSLPWAKVAANGSKLKTKYPYVVHAEANSILNAKNTPTLSGASIYVTMFPCNECAKLIIQAGIREVVFYEDKHIAAKNGLRPDESYQASCRLLSMAGVKCRQHKLQLPLTLQEMDYSQPNGTDRSASPRPASEQ